MGTIRDEVQIAGDHLETLKRCGGYYQCPRDKKNRRLGPLVGYAGKYKAADGSKKAWVGDVYYNYAPAEELPHVNDYFASKLATIIDSIESNLKDFESNVVLGAPMGGLFLASALGRALDRRVIYAEKKVTAVATADRREESILVLDRHEVRSGDKVMLVEDVCNNFLTTDKVIDLVEQTQGQVVTIACFLNRSERVSYQLRDLDLPVISLLHIPTLQYKQEDPEVAADIAAGNVVWKPKNEWARLEEAMARAKA